MTNAAPVPRYVYLFRSSLPIFLRYVIMIVTINAASSASLKVIRKLGNTVSYILLTEF